MLLSVPTARVLQLDHGVCEQEENTGPFTGEAQWHISAPFQREPQRRGHHLQLGGAHQRRYVATDVFSSKRASSPSGCGAPSRNSALSPRRCAFKSLTTCKIHVQLHFSSTLQSQRKAFRYLLCVSVWVPRRHSRACGAAVRQRGAVDNMSS